MTAQTRAALKLLFEDGDTPPGSTYADLIDSFISVADSTAQSTSSDFTAPTIIASTEVSSPLGNFSKINVSNIVGNPTVTAMTVGVLKVTGVSAGSLYVTGSVLSIEVDTTASTTSSGGQGGAVPASAALFFTVTINGTNYKVPAFD